LFRRDHIIPSTIKPIFLSLLTDLSPSTKI